MWDVLKNNTLYELIEILNDDTFLAEIPKWAEIHTSKINEITVTFFLWISSRVAIQKNPKSLK